MSTNGHTNGTNGTKAAPKRVDVLVCGAGPAGLLTAYGLQRMGIDSCVVERHIKADLPMYGRACTLYPRSMELLEQYDLLDAMAQVGYVGRGSTNYKDGKKVTQRGWHGVFSQLDGTFIQWCLNLRLKYSEDIFRAHYTEGGGRYVEGYELKGLKVRRGQEYPVEAEIQDHASGKKRIIEAKYLVGADGARSVVRNQAGIAMPQDATPYSWVRVDGVVKTDMPDADMGYASIESPTHGNVLWVRLDHGRTRIGYVFSPALQQKYGDTMTKEQVVYEAEHSMQPFNTKIEIVDWYTVYSVKTALAEQYIKDDCIIIAGDAAHTHSSGAAQGMNTGIHDATNLTWKLAGVLKGWYHPSVLSTYESERRPSAQHLITLDKSINSLISGIIPKTYNGTSTDPHHILRETLSQSMQFNIGLGIHYDENILNRNCSSGTVTCGFRVPDVLVYAPGAKLPTRLHKLMPNTGAFTLVVFAGEPLLTSTKIAQLRTYLDRNDSFINKAPKGSVRQLTIISGNKASADAALGVGRFGDAYYDWDNSAHFKFGVSVEEGGVVVIRPEGILGFACRLDQGGEVDEYFGGFMRMMN